MRHFQQRCPKMKISVPQLPFDDSNSRAYPLHSFSPLVGRHWRVNPSFEYHKWDRRQDISACETPCAWAANLASCSTTDISCYCKIVDSRRVKRGGLCDLFTTYQCNSCGRNLEEFETICAGSGPPVTGATTLPLGGTSAATGIPTTGITTGNPTSCAAQCAGIATALTSCADVTVFVLLSSLQVLRVVNVSRP